MVEATEETTEIPLDAAWKPEKLGVAALVQDAKMHVVGAAARTPGGAGAHPAPAARGAEAAGPARDRARAAAASPAPSARTVRRAGAGTVHRTDTRVPAPRGARRAALGGGQQASAPHEARP